MRRVAALALVFLLVIPSWALADGFTVDARAAILIEAESGRVLFSQNSDEMLPMASTTKIMTCLLALENAQLDALVKTPREASGITGTSIYLSEGETLTMEQLLYGLMLRSGNDAAASIAIYVGGSQQGFVDMMNARAQEMGIDASFANPHGLDAEGHKASAAAMAELMRQAIKNEDFVRIVGTQEKIIPWEGNEYSRVLYNKNRLLTSYEGTIGGKTGYTTGAGRCLVFAAERNGMTLIGCVLNCSTWFDTAEMLLDYGFENYSASMVFEAGETVERVEVIGGQTRSVELIAAGPLRFPMGLDEKHIVNIETNRAVAPIYAGAAAGSVSILVEGKTVASVDLVYAADVPENSMEGALGRVLDMWLMKL